MANEDTEQTTEVNTGTETENANSNEHDSNEDWLTPDVRAAKDFDPFTPESEEADLTTDVEGTTSAEGTKDGEGKEGDGTQTQTPDGQPASETNTTGNTSGTPTEQTQGGQTELQQLQATVQQLLQNQSQGGNAQQQPKQTSANEEQPNPMDVVPDYGFQFPPQLVDMLNSEDAGERTQALGALTQGVAQSIHKTVMHTMKQQITSMQQGLPNAINQYVTQAQQADNIKKDFYGTYEHLDKPELRGLVTQVGQQVMQEMGTTQWSPQLRDTIAQRVNATIGYQAQPAQQPAPQQQPAQQPAMFGGTANAGATQSPAGTRRAKTQQDHIDDIFDL